MLYFSREYLQNLIKEALKFTPPHYKFIHILSIYQYYFYNGCIQILNCLGTNSVIFIFLKSLLQSKTMQPSEFL